MIPLEAAERETFSTEYRRLCGGAPDGPPPEVLRDLEELYSTIDDLDFPGVLLPRWIGSNLTLYAISPEPRDWRRLKPLLTAHLGPTHTTFDGVGTPLEESDVVDKYLSARGFYRVVRFYVPLGTARFAIGSLRRMRRLLTMSRKPDPPKPETTGGLLRSFQIALQVGNRSVANSLLERLRGQGRIDALNGRFLEIQMQEAFGEWDSIRMRGDIGAIAQTRRPAAVTIAIATAIYRTDVTPFEVTNNSAGCLDHFRNVILPELGGIFRSLPGNATNEVRKAFAVAALTFQPPRGQAILEQLTRPITQSGENLQEFLSWLNFQPTPSPSLVSTLQGLAALTTPGFSEARQALSLAIEIGNLEAYQLAGVLAGRIDDETRKQIERDAVLRGVFELVRKETGGYVLPRGWIEWFEMLDDPLFEKAVEVAREGSREWPLEEVLGDPTRIAKFCQTISEIPDGIARTRLAEALPYLVGWIRSDLRFPARIHVPLCLEILVQISLMPGRGEAELSITGLLLESVLATGLEVAEYKEVLDSLELLTQTAIGVRTVDWVLEILETLADQPCMDNGARSQFWYKILENLRPIASRIGARHRILMEKLSGVLGGGGAAEAFRQSQLEPEIREIGGVLRHLVGKSVAIYSLTEKSARRAAEILQDVVPGIRVDIVSDHVGSDRLEALARRADFFVAVARSAKHAATNFISDRRGGREILWPSGKGASSILKALEEAGTATVSVA